MPENGNPRSHVTARRGHVALEDALRKLTSLHDGDLGVIDVVDCGRIAIPAVRAILFDREPSGLYETRRRAVEVLARLGAFDILLAYPMSQSSREIADPVEQTGEDAVTSAVARALANGDGARARPVLLDVAKRRLLAGIVEALGTLRCDEAMPYFIDALADDFTRPAAEAAIRNIGPSARSALMEVAASRATPGQREYVSRLRQRCSALTLLAAFGSTPEMQSTIDALMDDDSPGISVLACEIALSGAALAAKHRAIRRLISLISADWPLSQEIIEALAANIDHAKPLIEDVLARTTPGDASETGPNQVRETLRRILARAGANASDRE